ncbi:hypothetical protein AAAC51_26705 [Priestia megaterium]
MATFQQIQGSNSIVYYATSIARQVGLAAGGCWLYGYCWGDFCGDNTYLPAVC